MEPPSTFQAFSPEHLVAIFLTVALPFALAALARRSGSRAIERAIGYAISAVLIANYVAYLLFIRPRSDLTWEATLPMQMCDWAMVVIVVAIASGNRRWFEVAYFWGIGGTLQAVLTPNLRFGFPDPRFFSFFVAHSGIIVGVVFLMLTRRLRPYPMSIVRAFSVVGVIFRHRAHGRSAYGRELRLSPAQTGGVFAPELSLGLLAALSARRCTGWRWCSLRFSICRSRFTICESFGRATRHIRRIGHMDMKPGRSRSETSHWAESCRRSFSGRA